MLVPAQHHPISLIGSMWNLGSRWPSQGEGGVCGGGKSGDSSVTMGCKAVSVTVKHANTSVKTPAQRGIPCDLHVLAWGCGDTHIRINQRNS